MGREWREGGVRGMSTVLFLEEHNPPEQSLTVTLPMCPTEAKNIRGENHFLTLHRRPSTHPENP